MHRDIGSGPVGLALSASIGNIIACTLSLATIGNYRQH
jgi:hypothetical protein